MNEPQSIHDDLEHAENDTQVDGLLSAGLARDDQAQIDGENELAENEDEAPVLEVSSSVILGAVANLCSATLGAGILSLPYAFQQAGLVAGTVLLLGSGVATAVSIRLLTDACEFYKCPSYEGLVEMHFGKKARTVVEVSILVFCIGCAVAYCIAIGDILELSGLLFVEKSRSLSMLTVWCVLMFPLSLLRTMRSLQFSSTIGMASIATLVVASFVHLLTDEFGPIPEPSNTTDIPIVWKFVEEATWTFVESTDGLDAKISLWEFMSPANGVVSVLQACPIILFAFSCQVNVCAIYTELPGNHKSTLMERVSWVSVGFCSLLYACLSGITLGDFGFSLQPNVLSNYAPPEGIMQVACAGMALAVIFAFPLNIFPARTTIAGMLLQRQRVIGADGLEESLLSSDDRPRESGDQESLLLDGNNQQSYDAARQDAQNAATIPAATDELEEIEVDFPSHIGLTTLLAGLSIGLALIVPNISVVFGLLGGTAASILGFIIPGALGIKLCHDREHAASWTRLQVSRLLVGGGAVIGLVTTTVTLVRAD